MTDLPKVACDLTELDVLAEKATERPWTALTSGPDTFSLQSEKGRVFWSSPDVPTLDNPYNALFVEALVNAWPTIRDRLRLADTLYDEVKKWEGFGNKHISQALEAYERQRRGR